MEGKERAHDIDDRADTTGFSRGVCIWNENRFGYTDSGWCMCRLLCDDDTVVLFLHRDDRLFFFALEILCHDDEGTGEQNVREGPCGVDLGVGDRTSKSKQALAHRIYYRNPHNRNRA